jgi:hypothetical protein
MPFDFTKAAAIKARIDGADGQSVLGKDCDPNRVLNEGKSRMKCSNQEQDFAFSEGRSVNYPKQGYTRRKAMIYHLCNRLHEHESRV